MISWAVSLRRNANAYGPDGFAGPLLLPSVQATSPAALARNRGELATGPDTPNQVLEENQQTRIEDRRGERVSGKYFSLTPNRKRFGVNQISGVLSAEVLGACDIQNQAFIVIVISSSGVSVSICEFWSPSPRRSVLGLGFKTRLPFFSSVL